MKWYKAMFSFHRFRAVVVKEVTQLRRDKISSRIPFVMPVVMMLLFGYVVNTEVDNAATAVFDQSQTAESRAYIEMFHNTGYFAITYNAHSEAEIEEMLGSGKIKAGLIIPPNFAEDMKAGKNPAAALIVDGSDSTVARTILSSGALTAQNEFLERTRANMAKSGAVSMDNDGAALNTRVLYNPNMEIRYFTIPGLVGLIMQILTVMLTAFAMVREKERGTIEQLIVTPVRPSELILGKLVPYVALGYFGFLFALAICRFYFKVAIAGSAALLLALGFLFVICSLSIGMLISTFAKNQFQAMMGVVGIMLPSILLSGFMFPIEAMPLWAKPLTYLIPLTHFLRIDRGIILKGTGMGVLWPDALALLVFMVIILAIAIKRFNKSLD